MTSLYIVLEIICVFFVLLGFYLWKKPRSEPVSPKKLSRYRWGATYGSGVAILILIRLLTHTYK